MYYPHADDENVAMGYANYSNYIQENDTMVTIGEKAFRAYILTNYFQKLNKDALLEILDEQLGTDVMIDMAQKVWELPFELSSGKVQLVDPEALLVKHSEEECYTCPDWGNEEDYDLITYDEDEEYAPYDEKDEELEEIEDEKK
jgi:hypothetical protein